MVVLPGANINSSNTKCYLLPLGVSRPIVKIKKKNQNFCFLLWLAFLQVSLVFKFKYEYSLSILPNPSKLTTICTAWRILFCWIELWRQSGSANICQIGKNLGRRSFKAKQLLKQILCEWKWIKSFRLLLFWLII